MNKPAQTFATGVVTTALFGTVSVFFVRCTAIAAKKTLSAAFDLLPELPQK